MSATKHELRHIVEDLHGWNGICSCGSWACSVATSRERLQQLHDQHRREVKRR